MRRASQMVEQVWQRRLARARPLVSLLIVWSLLAQMVQPWWLVTAARAAAEDSRLPQLADEPATGIRQPEACISTTPTATATVVTSTPTASPTTPHLYLPLVLRVTSRVSSSTDLAADGGQAGADAVEPCIVPNVVGMLEAAARADIEAAVLTPGRSTYEHSRSVTVGRVLRQSLAAGTRVPQGTEVNITVSLGPELVAVPNVVGLTQANAESAIRAATLTVGSVTQEASDTVPAGRVIRQVPQAGTEVLPTTPVDLVISTGPVNDAPRFTSSPVLSAVERQTYRYDANASDLDGDGLLFTLALAPEDMTIHSTTGVIAWTPAAEQVRRYDVTVRVEDEEGLFDLQTFILTVSGVNVAPVARDDTYAVRTGETLTVTTPGVLANDEDPNGDVLSTTLVTTPTNGSLDFNPDGTFTYTPIVPGSDHVFPNINLTRLSAPSITTSSTYSNNYLPQRLIDGNLGTSWFSSASDDDAWAAVAFPEPVAVREIHYRGNRQFGSTAHDFTSGRFVLLDASNAVVWESGNLLLPAPDRDVNLDVEALAGAPVVGVTTVRFEATGYEGTSDHGFAELTIFGDGPVVGLHPTQEWAWTAASIGSTDSRHGQVVVAPMVGDLDRDGRPEVLFVASEFGRLYVLNGEDGSFAWSADNMYSHSTSPVLADLDGDGFMEVAAVGSDGQTVRLFEHDGTLKDAMDTNLSIGTSNMAVADLDGDGAPEIVVPASGRIVALGLDGDNLVERWRSEALGCGNNSYRSTCIPLVSDVDLDDQPEVVAGRTIYDHEGNLQVQNAALPDGWNAVGNFDDDPYAEIVLVSTGQVWLLEHDLGVKWGPVALPQGGGGGPPTVADFDSDGWPEIGVAGEYRYVVFETDGSVGWAASIVDASSNRTGSTVFDFENDGAAEVVYRDEQHLWIYQGSDGTVRAKIPVGSSTTVEYPVIADVDADGEAEIVVPSDATSPALPDGTRRPPGLYVFGSPAGNWVRARTIWNQHTYHVTNIRVDGTVPTNEQPNWLLPSLNNFRENDFLPDEVSRADTFRYEVRDTRGLTATATVFLDLLPANTAPVILSTPPTTATAGFPYLYGVRVSDVDDDPLTFTLDEAPAGMTVDPVTGLVRWTPPNGAPGPHAVTVRVTDDDGYFVVQSWTISVVPPVTVPEVIGLTRAGAEEAIEAAGLRAGEVVSATHPTIPAGRIADQTPSGGAVAEPGSRIALTLSLGPAPEDVDDDDDGFTENEGDCDDDASSLFPGAADRPGDGIDQNCDGADALLPIAQIIVEPGTATLLVSDTLTLAATAVFTDGTSQPISALVDWQSTNPSVATIDDAGELTGQSAGSATLQASYAGRTGSATVVVRAPATSDTVPPTARILAPTEEMTITEPVTVTGIATDTNLLKWELSYAPHGEPPFTVLAESRAQVSGAPLGTLDPTLLLNGLYTLRLRVWDRGGNVAMDQIVVQVEGQQKIGHFTLAFTDLSISMADLPLQVTRSYDSRDKRMGDFGVGWRLGFRSMDLACTNPLGDGWTVRRGGLAYSLLPLRPHTCTLTLADGQVETFDFVPNPSVSAIVPFSLLSGRFQPRRGTTGTLRSLDSTYLAIVEPQPGDVQLLDDTTFGLYRPQRFQYVAQDGTSYLIHNGSGVQRVTDPNGNTLVLDENGIRHSSGAEVLFTRDSVGRIVRVTDLAGREQRYDYDANGDLVSHTDREGNSTRFRYDRHHYLLQIIDPLGRPVARNEYDDGRLIATTDATGNRIEITHELGSNLERIEDRLGNVTVLEYDEHGNTLARVDALGNRTEYTYDEHGNQLSETDPLGRTVTTVYDEDANVLATTDADGNTSHQTYNENGQVLTSQDPLGGMTTNEYDARGNLVQSIDPEGDVTSYSYDADGNLLTATNPNGHTTSYLYNARGNRVAEIDPLGHTTTYSYDVMGNLLAETVTRTLSTGAPELLTTRYEYNAEGQLVNVVDPLGHATRTTYDAIGREQSRRDPNGNLTTFEYDARGNLVKTNYPDGSSEQLAYDAEERLVARTDRDGHTTTYQYDPLGRLTRTVFPGGASTHVSYDAVGRVLAETDERGNVTSVSYAVNRQTRTDALGNVTVHHFDGLDRRTSTIDARGNTTTFGYDGRGQLVRTTYSDGTVSTAEYDASGNKVSETDQAGLTTRYEYDPLSRLVTVIDAAGGGTRYAYDELGNLISITDAGGHTTRMEYQPCGNCGERITRRIRPMGQSETFEYDPNGNVVRHTDFNGESTTYVYDSNNRVIRENLPDDVVIQYAYSPEGKLLQAGGEHRAYDARGRLLEATQADGQTLRYGYDAAGNRTAVTTPSGTTTYGFDALNRLAAVTAPGGGETRYTYDAVGNRASITYPNGAVATYTYDTLNRLLRIENRTGSGALISAYAYTLGAAGNRTRVVEEHSARAVDYTYDELYRLTREVITEPAASTSVHYQYNAVGNRLSRNDSKAGVTTYAYDANDRLTVERRPSESLLHSYDANGNLLSQSNGATADAYGYDSENRLVLATIGLGDEPGTVRYGYDTDGIRTSKATDGMTTRYLVDKNRPYAEVLREQTGTSSVSYVYGDDLISMTRPEGTTHYYHYDGQLSTRQLSDGSGTITDAYTYDAFGVLLNSFGTTPNLYRYTGEQYDPNVGFYYLRARYYAPQVGRFITTDPFHGSVFEPKTLHRYLYANADPVNNWDPSGLFTVPEISIGMAITTILVDGVLSGILSAGIVLFQGGDEQAIIDAFVEGFVLGAVLPIPFRLVLKAATILARSIAGAVASSTARKLAVAFVLHVNKARNPLNAAYPIAERIANIPFGRTILEGIEIGIEAERYGALGRASLVKGKLAVEFAIGHSLGRLPPRIAQQSLATQLEWISIASGAGSWVF